MKTLKELYEASIKAHNEWADAYWSESAEKVNELYNAKEIALSAVTDARIASFAKFTKEA